MSNSRIRGRSLLIFAATLALSACATGPPTFHRAFEQALRFGNEPRRGVVLYLHGCNGFGGSQRFTGEGGWIRYLTDRGFLVVAPDSFADPRPGQSCQSPYPSKERIYQIRAQQTELAIERLRATYPTSKLLVWGHSEGGGVANLVTATVDGIITTGYQCGYRSTSHTRIRPDVPLLAIMGTADPYIREILFFNRASSADELCRMVLSSPKWQAVIVPNMSHEALLDLPQVRDAVSRFLAAIAP